MKQARNFKRVLLKLSGEAFLGRREFGIDPDFVARLAKEIGQASKDKQIAIVIGAGNFFRGRVASEQGLDRVTADQMGMIATLLNALALREALIQVGLGCQILSAIGPANFIESFDHSKAINYLREGKIVILAGGTGHPYFTTDTAAALRALEVQVEVLIKATRVEGVFDHDPLKNKKAQVFHKLSFDQAIMKDLKVMDQAAIALCRDHHLPIIVFNLMIWGNLTKVLLGEKVGTLIS